MLVRFTPSSILLQLQRSISTTSVLCKRPPPKAEFERSLNGKRNKNWDPYNRLWRLSTKSAEPFNVKGGSERWTKMTHLMRGVQMPGYINENGKYIFVKEMIPEIVMPDLTNCQLKPYVAYNVEPIETPKLTAKELFNKIYKDTLIENYLKEAEEIEAKKPTKPSKTS